MSGYRGGGEPRASKKSCYWCRYLTFHDEGYESHSEKGYACEKRDYKTEREEWDHLDKLNDPYYLAKAKVCFEAKNDK